MNEIERQMLKNQESIMRKLLGQDCEIELLNDAMSTTKMLRVEEELELKNSNTEQKIKTSLEAKKK